MTEFIIQYMAPIMFGTLILMLLMGYPVAFSLAACGLLFGTIGVELGMFQSTFWQGLVDNVYDIMRRSTLLAIPFFTFMGLILERSGMAEDLLDTIGQLFGPIRGGLAYAVILVGALLAATTGVVAASVIAMGLISLPIMLRYGYKRSLAAGVITASGTLAQIIPPSLVLIIMADQLKTDISNMYTGAFIPGLVLVGLYMGYVFIVTMLDPKAAPPLPREARTLGGGITSLLICVLVSALAGYGFMLLVIEYANAMGWTKIAVGAASNFGIWMTTAVVVVAYSIAVANRTFKLELLSRLAQQVVIVLMPPLALIFLVLGTIFVGLATPTEAGAMGALGALVLAVSQRRLNFTLLKQALDTTTKLSAFVMFILIGSRVFSYVFYWADGHKWVEGLLLGLPGGEIGFLIVVSILVFLLAFFLDFFELAFIVVPLLEPVARKLGIDVVWFGVLLGINLQTSFMHPPFGFALFYLRSVAPRVPYIDRLTKLQIAPITTGQIYWGAVPFVAIQIIMVGLTIAFPQMVMHYKSGLKEGDPSQVKTLVPAGDAGQPNFGFAPPDFGVSPPPNFGMPGENKAPDNPSEPPPLDLSQPPKFN